MKMLSIEIDNEKIKIVEGSKSIKGDFMTINKCLSINVPANSMDDGKIINLDLIKGTIEKALLENSIKAKNTVFVINSNSVITRKMELPLLKRKSDTMSMIKFELEQLLDANLNQMIIFKMSKIIKIDNINRAKYVVYGISVNVYNQYIELSKILKLRLTAFDISSNYLEQIPKQNLRINDRIYINGINVFINIGYNTIVFCVLNQGINEFTRIIYLNSNSNSNYNSDEEEMYKIDKVAENSNYIYMNTDIIQKENNTDKWLEEIIKYIRYYYSIDKENTIDKIYIYGACSEIVGIEPFFYINLNIAVEIINEISNFRLSNLCNDINIIEYFHAALALFIKKNDINFLTDKINNHKFKFNFGVAVMVASLFFVLTLAFYTQSYLIYYKLLKNEVETMSWYVSKEENINSNKEIENLKYNIERLKEYNERVVKVKEVIRKEDAVSSNMLREIANAKPSDTKIMFITVDKNNIQMQCSSTEMEEVMLFVKNLSYINLIESTYIPYVDVKKESEHALSYSIICKLRGGFDESKQ